MNRQKAVKKLCSDPDSDPDLSLPFDFVFARAILSNHTVNAESEP